MNTYCWACAAWCDPDRACPECGAPAWREDSNRADGVYVIRAECGLVKIGFSTRSVDDRLLELKRKAHEPLEVLCILRAANSDVERWLHDMFADIRDPNWARGERLPNPTEWFWPSPSIDRLCAETEFLRDGRPWEEAAL